MTSMHTLVKSQTVFIDSSTCGAADTPWQYTLGCGPLSLCCNQDEIMVLTLKRFSVLATWTWLPACILTVELNEVPHTITLPAGNPTLRELATMIDKQITTSGFQCLFDRPSNSLVFDSDAGDVQLVFPDTDVAALFGFATATPGPAQSVKSQHPIVPLAFDSIKVCLDSVTPDYEAHSYTTASGELLQPTSCLAVLPVDVQPFTWLDYRNVDNSFALPVTNREIQRLSFRLTDFSGAPLRRLPHHFIVLQVETYKRNDPVLMLMGSALVHLLA